MIRFLSILASNIRWMGWLCPFWFVYKPRDWKLTGRDIAEAMRIAKPGDMFITRADGFLSTWLIPGWWSHAGICVGDEVVHAVGEGVMQDHIIDFLHADYVVLLRPECSEDASKAVIRALGVVGGDYDFGYDFSDSTKFTCTELAAFCYPGIPTRRTLGHTYVTADDIVSMRGTNFKIVFNTKYRI